MKQTILTNTILVKYYSIILDCTLEYLTMIVCLAEVFKPSDDMSEPKVIMKIFLWIGSTNGDYK